MGKEGSILAPILIGALVLVASVAHAATETRHSGTIEGLSANGRTITIEELGPWTGGRLTREKLSVVVEPTTKIELVTRSQHGAENGWPGGFKASPLAASDLHRGDYATVTAERSHNRLVARSVTVVRPAEH
jgi:hypothetical protein